MKVKIELNFSKDLQYYIFKEMFEKYMGVN